MTLLKRANSAYREGKYKKSAQLYKKFLIENPGLTRLVELNTVILNKKLPEKDRVKLPTHKEKNLISVESISSNEVPDQTILNHLVRVPVEEKVSVVVPVYNALDDLKVCIERLVKHTDDDVDIIFIDDASPDPLIATVLEEASLKRNIRVFSNAENLGFTRTVNRGIELAGSNDVVLLNSDARVTPRWLQGLKRALSTDANIATVTPMSDRAGAFSAPNIGNDNNLPDGISEADYAVAFRRNSIGYYPTVPTGNGFCMYIRRRCLDELGSFDAEAFPRGYGEENDFCMRAGRAGWRHVIDDRTYIFHDRNKSFGEQKKDLVIEGRKIVDHRYPDYQKAINIFSSNSIIKAARNNAKKACDESLRMEIKPRALYVISTVTGGTPQTNRDLMLALEDVVEPWLFRCDSKRMLLFKITASGDIKVQEHELTEPVDPLTHTSYEYDKVISLWLAEYDFEIVHIRHLAWHSLALPQLAKKSGSRVINSFHDFYSICPTVKLLDENFRFCKGSCTNTCGTCQAELWPKGSIPELKHKWVKHWRNKFAKSLSFCDAFVTTSISAKETILLNLGVLNKKPFYIIEHGRSFEKFRKPDRCNLANETIKILVPGNIDSAKGGEVICELLKLDSFKKLEFHVLGKCHIKFNDPRVVMHGSYNRDDFLSHVDKISPHFGVIFSIWDETWCHTLTELWASGLPSVVFDFDTVARRVTESGCGWVFTGNDINELYQRIVYSYTSQEEYLEKLNFVDEWQNGFGLSNTVEYMACQYLNLYKGRDDTKDICAVVSPSRENLLDAPGSTHVRVWEKTKNDLKRVNTYLRMTPHQLAASVENGLIRKAIIQRTVLTAEQWKRIKPLVVSGKLSYCLDIDDDLLKVPADKDLDGFYKNYQKTLHEIAAYARKLLVSTQSIHEKYKKINSNIELVENELNIERWKLLPGKREATKNRKVIYFGSYTHKEDLELILDALKSVHEEFPEFKLVVVGIGKVSFGNFDWIEYRPVPKEYKNYPNFIECIKNISSDCCAGIAPLVNTEFNRGKSPLKVIEYFALGLPVVASDVGPYSSFSSKKWIEVVDNNKEDWAKAIKKAVSRNLDVSDFELIAKEAKENYMKGSFEFDKYFSW